MGFFAQSIFASVDKFIRNRWKTREDTYRLLTIYIFSAILLFASAETKNEADFLELEQNGEKYSKMSDANAYRWTETELKQFANFHFAYIS